MYIDDANAYISATPHTVKNPGWVYFTVSPKTYTGDVDVVWGFDTDKTKPVRAELYRHATYEVTKSFRCEPPLWYNYTLNPKHVWCWRDVSDPIYDASNTTIIGYNDFTEAVGDTGFGWADLPSNTVYWNVTMQKDWHDISGNFEKVKYGFGGMDTWFFRKGIPVTAGNTYTIRVFMDVPVCLSGDESCEGYGKYDFAIKPSHLTMAEAIAQGRLYFLDPWYDAGKSYRRAVNASCTACSANVTVPVLVNDTAWYNGSTAQYVWLTSVVVPNTALALSTVSYHYWNSESDYDYSNTAQDAGIPFDVDEGSGTDSGGWPDDAAGVYHMNGTDAHDSGQYGNHGTAVNNVAARAGKIGTGLYFDGSGDNVNIGDQSEMDGNASFTVCAWYNITDYEDCAIVSKHGTAATADYGWVLMTDANKQIIFAVSVGGGDYDAATSGANMASINRWFYACGTYDGATVKLYVNGDINATKIQAGAINSNACDVKIGDRHNGGYDCEGVADQVEIWNVTKSDDWIQARYNNTVGTQSFSALGGVETSGAAPPAATEEFYNVTIEQPANMTNTSDPTPDVMFRYNGTFDEANCELWGNGTGYGINATVINATSTNITVNASLADGGWLFFVNCSNSTYEATSDSELYLTIDTTGPLINVTVPANNSNLSYGWINITGHASDTNADSVSINDTDFGANAGSYASWNFTNHTMSEGTFWLRITANDTAGNENSTEIYFNIDRTAPTVTWLDPTPNNVTLEWDGCWINASVSETTGSCLLDWNGTNESLPQYSGTNYRKSKAVPDGNYTFMLWCNDSAGNLGWSTSRYVYIKAPPFSPGNPGPGGPPWGGEDIERPVEPLPPYEPPGFQWTIIQILAMAGSVIAGSYVMFRM